jgi:hypothetical protein
MRKFVLSLEMLDHFHTCAATKFPIGEYLSEKGHDLLIAFRQPFDFP